LIPEFVQRVEPGETSSDNHRIEVYDTTGSIFDARARHDPIVDDDGVEPEDGTFMSATNTDVCGGMGIRCAVRLSPTRGSKTWSIMVHECIPRNNKTH